jgi:hypothetical protein
MIISEYGSEVWEEFELRAGLELHEWEDSKFYPDADFFDIANMVVSLPKLNSEKVSSLTD